MSDSIIITGITVCYLLVVLAIGLKAKVQQQSSSLESYVAGGRHMGLLILFFIMGAEAFSATTFLGVPGWAYSKGAPALYIVAYMTLGVGMWWLLGPRVARLGRKFGYLTQADLLVDRFPSRSLGALIGVISVLALVPYLTIQVAGAGMLFEIATHGLVPFWLGALLASVVVTLYVYTSGLNGIGWTNMLQGVLMIVVAWVVGLALAHELYGGVGAMFTRLHDEAPEFLTMPGAQHMSWGAYSTAILVSTFGGIMWPHLFMKFYSADSERTLKKVFILSPLYAYLLVPIIIIGFAGILVLRDTPLERPDEVLLRLVVDVAHFSPWLIGVMLSGALAAAMSTAANLAHTAATVAARDVMRPLVMPQASDAVMVRWTRLLVVAVSLAAFIVALFNPASLVAMLLGAYGIIVQLFPLIVGALFWRKATTAGAYTGLVCGALVALLFQFVIDSPLGWHAGIWGLIANAASFVLVSRMTHASSRAAARDLVVEGERSLAAR